MSATLKGGTLRRVRVLRKGQQPQPGNIALTVADIARLTGKPAPQAGGSIRVEYERVDGGG